MFRLQVSYEESASLILKKITASKGRTKLASKILYNKSGLNWVKSQFSFYIRSGRRLKKKKTIVIMPPKNMLKVKTKQ